MSEKLLQLTTEETHCVQKILHSIVPDRTVLAFGSRTTAHYKPYSDLDLVVMGHETLPAAMSADLHQAFSESNLAFKVDLVIWSELTDNFKHIIQDHHVVIQTG
jgi:predicted nucleotidyltransferase